MQSQARNRRKANHDKGHKKQHRSKHQRSNKHHKNNHDLTAPHDNKSKNKGGHKSKHQNFKSQNNLDNQHSNNNNSDKNLMSAKDFESNTLSASVELVADGILLAFGVAYIILCPFTKVEESFNMQASHDVMFEFNNLENYDHIVYPGKLYFYTEHNDSLLCTYCSSLHNCDKFFLKRKKTKM